MTRGLEGRKQNARGGSLAGEDVGDFFCPGFSFSGFQISWDEHNGKVYL